MATNAGAYRADQRANLIVELTRLAVETSDVPAAVTPILGTLVSHTAAAGSAYFQSSGEVFSARASSGAMPEGPAMDAMLAHGLPGDTPLMRALEQSAAPLFFDDTGVAPETAGFPDLGVASLAAAPVRDTRGVLLGAFLMHTFEAHVWSDREADLFGAIAGALSSLTARLVAEEQAVAAREGALRALGLAIERRDNETKGHTDRVVDLALRVADALAIDDALRTSLRWGSFLHDLGKIGIPDAVLLKRDRLNDDERAIMRSHPEIGHEFAGQLGFLPRGSLDLILHHHERWAGGGYPSGKSGLEIPLTARVFAVCDVYDALTSERPYKRAWPHDEAFQEIRAERGRHFDPAIVDMFLKTANPRTD